MSPRKTTQQRMDSAEERFRIAKERLKAEKAKARASEHKAHKSRAAILGRLLDDWMKDDAELRDRVMHRLEEYLSKDRERLIFGLAPKKETTQSTTA